MKYLMFKKAEHVARRETSHTTTARVSLYTYTSNYERGTALRLNCS